MPVRHKSKDYVLPLMVTTGTRCNLIGRNWFQALPIQVSVIHNIEQEQTIKTLLRVLEEMLKPKITRFLGSLVNLKLKESATPKFLKSQQVPFALRPVADCELLASQS